MLEALARALRLDADGAAHLRTLAAGGEDIALAERPAVAPGIQQLLDGWAGAAVGDAALAALVEELSADPDFRALWARHDVRAVRGDAKRVRHPTAGEMTLSRQVLSLPDADGQVVLAYFAEPGTASAAALASLDA